MYILKKKQLQNELFQLIVIVSSYSVLLQNCHREGEARALTNRFKPAQFVYARVPSQESSGYCWFISVIFVPVNYFVIKKAVNFLN